MAQTSLRERARIISFQENESVGAAWTKVPWVAHGTASWIPYFHSDSGQEKNACLKGFIPRSLASKLPWCGGGEGTERQCFLWGF